MAYYQLVNKAFEAIQNGAQTPESVASYLLTICKCKYSDALAASRSAFRQIHGA